MGPMQQQIPHAAFMLVGMSLILLTCGHEQGSCHIGLPWETLGQAAQLGAVACVGTPAAAPKNIMHGIGMLSQPIIRGRTQLQEAWTWRSLRGAAQPRAWMKPGLLP